jgi:uncharacterized lipoprotein YbaY
MKKLQATQNNRWIITVMILVALILLGILVYAMLTSSGVLSPFGYSQPSPFITIEKPQQGDNLDLTWAVQISGQAGGLFEGNLTIQALDASGQVLAQESIMIDSSDVGTGGSELWSAYLRIDAPTGSQGQILAFWTSPKDGSRAVEDRIEVGYGEAPFKRDLVAVEDHLWKLAVLNDRPPIEDTILTLQFENFQAVGHGGCNNFQSSYERRSSKINFGFVTSTAKECELPVGVLGQEAAYFTALEESTSVQTSGTRLSLFDNSSIVRLEYDAVILGNILGPENDQLPEGTNIYIQLIDSSLSDTKKSPIAEQQISDFVQLPIDFALIYNPKQIIADHIYEIDVKIEDSAGNLIYTNPYPVPVITTGNPSIINILVEPVDG